ncbi:MAG: radical SAM protein [Nanoarchaeota archaeon]|nr:radical SAM protein [Nanoarchaeota archaeon]
MKCIKTFESNLSYFTKKYLFSEENKTVESTYVNRGDKNIICLSSMYGCPVGCKFCASGKSYFGNLKSSDILFMANYIINDSDNKIKTLFSFMGSGEPLLNVWEVSDSIKELSRISDSYFSMSVSGLGIDNIDSIANDKEITKKPKIQFSLHSPFNFQRRELIPKTEDIEKVLGKLQLYKENTGKDIDLNYILLNNINDSKAHCKKLLDIINQTGFNLKINEYHLTNSGFLESKNKKKFILLLRENGVYPEVYATDGVDVNAACGQLVSEYRKGC